MIQARLGIWARVPRSVILLGAGACAALGQAPWGLWPVAVMGYALALWALGRSARPFREGWVFGFAHFTVALHWILAPFFVAPEVTGWMAPFALAGLAGGLALFWGAAAWGGWRVLGGGPFAVALALALAEYARGRVLTGFPWAEPGHIWIDTAALPLAALWGPFGFTLITLAIAAALARLDWRSAGAGGAALAAILALGGIGRAPAIPEGPMVRLVQPNAPQHLKWQPDMIPVFFRRGLEQTAAPADGPLALILWPETALPQILERSDRARGALAQVAQGAPILVGAHRFDAAGNPRNVAALLDGQGAVAAVYDKHHLVPFGEYLPMGALLGRLGLRALAAQVAGRYVPGPGPATLDVPGLGRLFPMICYEAIFPGYIAQVPRPRALAHLTNDAWFGDFAGPRQHLALARLRAAEQRLPVIRAANTGISAVIDARGRIVAALPLGVSGHLDAALPPDLGPGLYAQLGDWPPLGLAFLAFWAIWAKRRGFLH